MKEYKIISRKAFESNKSLEKRINQLAFEGWSVKLGNANFNTFILERTKNR